MQKVGSNLGSKQNSHLLERGWQYFFLLSCNLAHHTPYMTWWRESLSQSSPHTSDASWRSPWRVFAVEWNTSQTQTSKQAMYGAGWVLSDGCSVHETLSSIIACVCSKQKKLNFFSDWRRPWELSKRRQPVLTLPPEQILVFPLPNSHLFKISKRHSDYPTCRKARRKKPHKDTRARWTPS